MLIAALPVLLGLAVGLTGCASGGPSTPSAEARAVEEQALPMADLALAAGEIETARRIYRLALDLHPGLLHARMGLAQTEMLAGDEDEGLRRYHAILEDHPPDSPEPYSSPDAVFLRDIALAAARAHVAKEELEPARGVFEYLLDATAAGAFPPEDGRVARGWAQNGLGVVALLEGDDERARWHFSQAVLAAPGEAVFRRNLEALARVRGGGVSESSPAAAPPPGRPATVEQDTAGHDPAPPPSDRTVAVEQNTTGHDPEPQPPAAVASPPTGDQGSEVRARRHLVKRGETLIGIARRYRIPLDTLRAANGITGDYIRAGRVLLIPPS